ncbi:HIT family protein [Candidatus Aenigmatarchaeota archaeon]
MMNECLFCKLVKGEIPTKKVYEDESILAFLDINPCTEGHTVVIPKKHNQFLEDMSEDDIAYLFQKVTSLASSVKKAVNADGYNMGINDGHAAGSEIPHVHIHIIPRYKDDQGGAIQSIVRTQVQREKLDEILNKITSELSGASVPEKNPYDDMF